MISDVRAKVDSSEPVLDVEFIQVLQDMIGDLTGAPEPVVVKLFSPDAELLDHVGAASGRSAQQVKIGGETPIVDVEDGIENTTSGPAVDSPSNPEAAARAGFSAEDSAPGVAMVEGEPATAPVMVKDRPYTLRVRFPARPVRRLRR